MWIRSNPHLGQSPPPPYSFTFPLTHFLPHLLLFSFSLSYSLHLFSCFSIRFHSRIVPLRFQAGCRRRRLNLALFLYVDFVLYVFLPARHYSSAGISCRRVSVCLCVCVCLSQKKDRKSNFEVTLKLICTSPL